MKMTRVTSRLHASYAAAHPLDHDDHLVGFVVEIDHHFEDQDTRDTLKSTGVVTRNDSSAIGLQKSIRGAQTCRADRRWPSVCLRTGG